MASRTHISLPDAIFFEVQKEAKRQLKTVDDMVGELVLRALRDEEAGLQKQLDGLTAYGQQRAVELGSLDSEVVDVIREWREDQRSRHD